jgi:hypothetical protein
LVENSFKNGFMRWNMDKNLLCACGQACSDCVWFQEDLYESARKFRELVKKYDMDVFFKHLNEDADWSILQEKFSKFKEIDWFMEFLDNIIMTQCPKTCQTTGGCTFFGTFQGECGIVKCSKSKGYSGCWECDAFEDCDMLKFVNTVYGGSTHENLRVARDEGVGAVRSHGNQYYAFQKEK